MGVDYYMVSGYGVKIADIGDRSTDDVELPGKFEIAEFGSRNYGGEGTFALVLRSTHRHENIHEDDSLLIDPSKKLPAITLEELRAVAQRHGLEITSPLGWIAGVVVS